MNVLLVHNTADLYGASRSLLRLATGLISQHHGVTAVLPERGPLSDALQTAGVRVFVHPSLLTITRSAASDWGGRLALCLRAPLSIVFLAWLMNGNRIDLVHTNTALILSPAIAAFILRRPHVWHIREFFTEFPTIWPLHQRLMCALSSAVIAVSEAVASQFLPHQRHKVHVIHNGFPVEEFEGVADDRVARLRRRFPLAEGPLIGVVGRIKWIRKGQEIFVRAAAQLQRDHPGARFLLIGSPYPGNEDHLHRLLVLVEQLGLGDKVIYLGDVEDIKAAYSMLDIAVLTSTQPEPFGGVVIEAMAMGRPVVGTAVGGTPEQIVHGVTGLLVPAGDAGALAASLDVLLRDRTLREAMGCRGRERFLANFTFAPFFERIVSLYAKTLQAC